MKTNDIDRTKINISTIEWIWINSHIQKRMTILVGNKKKLSLGQKKIILERIFENIAQSLLYCYIFVQIKFNHIKNENLNKMFKLGVVM